MLHYMCRQNLSKNDALNHKYSGRHHHLPPSTLRIQTNADAMRALRTPFLIGPALCGAARQPACVRACCTCLTFYVSGGQNQPSNEKGG